MIFRVLAACIAVCGFVRTEWEARSAQPPNIILILSDDLGHADLGIHGGTEIPTPHIDRIGAEGVRFTTAYANGAFCTPTRAALLSGRYQHRFGNEDLSNVTGPLPLAIPTLAERLRAVGYDTAMVGKWHLGSEKGFTPTDRGFGSFFGFLGGGHIYLPNPKATGEYTAPILRDRTPVREERYLTNAFGAEAAEFVKSRKTSDKPFFLYLAFNAVHTPVLATPEYLRRTAHIADPKRHTYAAMLVAMDDAVGAVMNALEVADKTRDTLVIFHNDNGGPTTRNAINGSRNAPLRGSKCETFEGGIRVPLLMKWPNVIAPGTMYRNPVISFDITATVLTLAGADVKNLDGVNLLPFAQGKGQGVPHEQLFWRCRTRSDNYAARRGDWKFVHSTEGSETPGPNQKPAEDMLFHLADDPYERNNLARKHPEKLAELKAIFEAWSAQVDADCRSIGIVPRKAPYKPPGS